MGSNDDVKRIDPKRSRGGRWVRIGDEEYKVPALSLIAVQEMQETIPALASIRGVPSPEQMRAIFGVIHRAMVRNYPEMTVDDVGDMLDLSNFSAVLEGVLEVSGFKRSATPSGEASGEPMASTGVDSTSP